MPHHVKLSHLGFLAWIAVSSGGIDARAQAPEQPALATPPTVVLTARVIATGLRGAHGIRQVGRFHAGGPFTSNPEFLLQTQTGRALDPERLLVAVDGNLGAATGNRAHATGTLLSIDPRAAKAGQPIEVQPDAGRLARTDGAPVQVYSAQSHAFLNRQHNASAHTADFGAVSSPRYISINNAFGRPWIANAPFGRDGAGSESVLDPDGAPLANAPSDLAGGVFVGDQTGRTSVPKAVRAGGWFASLWNRQDSAQLTPGAIDKGALGTALLGSSPDGSGFAVFAVVTGNGAVVQVHVQDGVDGLAPPGTIDVGDQDPGLVGIAFKWNPRRALYVADAKRDRLVVLDLTDDTRQFKLESVHALSSPWLRQPVDLAATVPEIANARFASHTTLAGGSDLYVANRGDGSLLRLDQDGKVLARAWVDLPSGGRLGPTRLVSIAVGADAQRIWLIAQTPGHDDCVLLEVDAFDAAGAFASRQASVPSEANEDATRTATAGARLFSVPFDLASGLGPLFNADSCVACHPGPGGGSGQERHFARRVAHMDPATGRILPIQGQTHRFAQRLTMGQAGAGGNAITAPLPREANVVSLRMPLALFAAGRLDEIPDAAIEAQAVSKGDGIKGRVHYVDDPAGTRRVGRYGWKADVATLDEMVAEALGNEMGVTSLLASHPTASPKDDGTAVRALAAYLRSLPPPDASAERLTARSPR